MEVSQRIFALSVHAGREWLAIAKFDASKMHRILNLQKNVPANNCHLKVSSYNGQNSLLHSILQRLCYTIVDITDRPQLQATCTCLMTTVT